MFKKKDPLLDNPDFSSLPTGAGNPNPGMGGMDNAQMNEYGMPPAHAPNYDFATNLSTMGMQSMQSNAPQQGMDKDLQIISLKLDAIKSELDNLNQRMKNLEMIAEKEQQPKKWY